MTSSEVFKAVDEALAEVSAKLASGTALEGKLNPIPLKAAPESGLN